MPAMWGAVALGGLNLGMGFMADKKAEKNLKKLRKAMEKRVELARERFTHYKDTYGGAEQQMVNDAMQGVNPDLEQVGMEARADVAGAYDRQQQEQERELQSMGLDPSSGRFQSGARRMDMEQASQEAMQVNNARRQESIRAENETRRMREGVGQFGAQMMQQGARDVQQAQQQKAQMFGNNAQQYRNMANNMFANASSMAGFAMGNAGGGGGGNPEGGGGFVTNSAGNAPTTGNFMDTQAAMNPGFDPSFSPAGGNYMDEGFTTPRSGGGFPSNGNSRFDLNAGQGLDLDNYGYNRRGGMS